MAIHTLAVCSSDGAKGDIICQMLLDIQQSNSPAEITDLFRDLRDELSSLSDNLVSQEMTLVEQFEDIQKEFERNYTELATGTTETAATSFARMRELENEFHERLTEVVMVAVDKFIKGDVGGDADGKEREGTAISTEMEDQLRDVRIGQDT